MSPFEKELQKLPKMMAERIRIAHNREVQEAVALVESAHHDYWKNQYDALFAQCQNKVVYISPQA